MYSIGVDVSPRQRCKLRNGEVVTVKQGTGMNLIVRPENYNVLNRAFNKRKGAKISLDNEELQRNEEISMDDREDLLEAMEEQGVNTENAVMGGAGLYSGRGVKKYLKKHHVGRKARNTYKNPLVRNTVRSAITAALAEEGVPPVMTEMTMNAVEKKAGVSGSGMRRAKVAPPKGYGMYAGRGLIAGAGMYAGKGFDDNNLVRGKYEFNTTQPQALEQNPQWENAFMNVPRNFNK